MSATILFWESDPTLRKAMYRTLSWKGFHPIALEDPSQLPKAVKLEEPELSIIEGDWQPGSKINFYKESSQLVPNGGFSFILPSCDVSSSEMQEYYGIVLGNLRKPFGSVELFSGIQSAYRIKGHLEKGPFPWEECLEVRRLKTEEEILSALKLRYEVYREIGYIDSFEEELEFDKYDPNSIILGAIINQNGTKELAGTLRIIRVNSNGSQKEELKKVFRHREIECSVPYDDDRANLPACVSFGITPGDLSLFDPGFGSSVSDSGIEVSSEICELSRLVIQPKYRRHRFGIERKLFELIVVDCCADQPRKNWFVIAIHPSRCAKFERLGFRKISALGTKFYTGISQPAILMTLDLGRYLCSPNPFIKDLDLNKLIYKVNGNMLSTLEDRSYSLERVAS